MFLTFALLHMMVPNLLSSRDVQGTRSDHGFVLTTEVACFQHFRVDASRDQRIVENSCMQNRDE